MTNNEIKKALECYRNSKIIQVEKGDISIDDILNLINRLEAENAQLKREIGDLESTQEISPEAKYLVDTKADKVISLLNEVVKSQEQTKAEAFKEFTEKAKEELAEWVGADNSIAYSRIKTVLDNLVEEVEKKYHDNRSDN